MTQEVQPLTWSKRTNIEEHQQFFSKINEIIGNLAPTVDEAEQAIAQATAAIASANDAVATANAASAAASAAASQASAAASQAQTAASTVAGYDGRLTAAEGGIVDLQAADQTMAGNISALGTRMTAAESKNSQQDTDIDALQTADAQNVKISHINEYAVGLTGNQIIDGIKSFKLPITIDRDNKAFQWMYFTTGLGKVELPPSTQNHAVEIRNSDGTERIGLHFEVDTNGIMRVYVSGNATDGTTSVGFNQRILSVSANGTVTTGW